LAEEIGNQTAKEDRKLRTEGAPMSSDQQGTSHELSERSGFAPGHLLLESREPQAIGKDPAEPADPAVSQDRGSPIDPAGIVLQERTGALETGRVACVRKNESKYFSGGSMNCQFENCARKETCMKRKQADRCNQYLTWFVSVAKGDIPSFILKTLTPARKNEIILG